MQRLYSLVLLLLFVHGAAAREQAMLARVTVYWHSAGSRECIAAAGPRLHAGHCAVDPKKIPYGSKIALPDDQLIAVDTGPAVVQRTAARRSGRTPAQRKAIVIDRYFESRREAQSWAASHPHFMTVWVDSPQPAEANISKAEE
jgi:3D (Asp-Asp-Asp) domain-containing protein